MKELQRPVAVVDVGSNSMRLAVIRVDAHGQLEVIEEARAVPRLIRDVQATGELRAGSIQVVLDVLADFQSIASGSGAAATIAVATAAVRDASNSDTLVERVREALGIELQVVTGIEEARFGFLGAVHGLPVTCGLVIDVGGGSVELVRFEDRRAVASWSLPLGAVRLTDEFLKSDPPSPQQLRALRKHVLGEVASARIPALATGEPLVGTGGTIRNLAKVDRAQHAYPLPRLHGYSVTRSRARAVTEFLRSTKISGRATVPGLNEDRADTIVAGAVVVQAVLDALNATQMVVSGQGLREGIALASCTDRLPDVDAVRDASVERTVIKFGGGRATSAGRRMTIVDAMVGALGDTDGPIVELALPAAVRLLDIGRSVDYYGRHRHTESLVLAQGLEGFSHREQALVCSLVRQAGQERYEPTVYRPLITAEDRPVLARASALIAAADAIEQRVPARSAIHVTCKQVDGALLLAGALPESASLPAAQRRFERATGLRLAFHD